MRIFGYRICQTKLYCHHWHKTQSSLTQDPVITDTRPSQAATVITDTRPSQAATIASDLDYLQKPPLLPVFYPEVVLHDRHHLLSCLMFLSFALLVASVLFHKVKSRCHLDNQEIIKSLSINHKLIQLRHEHWCRFKAENRNVSSPHSLMGRKINSRISPKQPFLGDVKKLGI